MFFFRHILLSYFRTNGRRGFEFIPVFKIYFLVLTILLALIKKKGKKKLLQIQWDPGFSLNWIYLL